jgi:hypothetical protein
METTLGKPIPAVDKAARKALRDLKLIGIEGAVDELQGEIIARMATGKKVKIKLKAMSPEMTRIRIKVGVVGDKTLAEQIMRRIQREL